jgi:MFS family permease
VSAPKSEHGATVARPGLTLFAASFGTLLVLIDYTTPLTTLPPTAASLHASLTAQTWVLTGTLVGLAALLLTMGSLADDFGRKRVFGAGAVLLLASNVLAAIAPGVPLFLTARVLQGCAGAAVLAPSLGLVGHAFPTGSARARATGIWGAAVGLGIAVGPVYSALCERAFGWRSAYWILAGLAGLLIVLTVLGVSESRSATPRRIDPLGVLTFAAGSTGLITALAEGRYGWGRSQVVVPLVLGVVLLGVFCLAEWRVREPMLDLALFRSPGFVASCSGAFFTGAAIVGLMSYLPTVLQRSLGVTPLTASGILAIWSGLSVVSALQARRLANRMSATTQVAISMTMCAVGEGALYGIHAGGGWAHLVPGLAVAGIGSGVLNAALARLAVASVPASRVSMGSGANNTARYLGSSLGVAVVVTIVAQASSARGAGAAIATGANHAILASAVLCLPGAALAFAANRADARGAARAAGAAPQTPAESPVAGVAGGSPAPR